MAPGIGHAAPEAHGSMVRHTVKAGETLYAIARTYNAQPDQIKKDNNLGNGAISVGQVLEIRKAAPLDEAAVVKPATPMAEKVAEAKGESPDSAVADNKMPGATVGYERIVEHGVASLWTTTPAAATTSACTAPPPSARSCK